MSSLSYAITEKQNSKNVFALYREETTILEQYRKREKHLLVQEFQVLEGLDQGGLHNKENTQDAENSSKGLDRFFTLFSIKNWFLVKETSCHHGER